MNNLIEKLDDKSAVIGIVGLGYVGLPLMLRYVEVGFKSSVLILMQKKLKNYMPGKPILSISLRLLSKKQ